MSDSKNEGSKGAIQEERHPWLTIRDIINVGNTASTFKDLSKVFLYKFKCRYCCEHADSDVNEFKHRKKWWQKLICLFPGRELFKSYEGKENSLDMQSWQAVITFFFLASRMVPKQNTLKCRGRAVSQIDPAPAGVIIVLCHSSNMTL